MGEEHQQQRPTTEGAASDLPGGRLAPDIPGGTLQTGSRTGSPLKDKAGAFNLTSVNDDVPVKRQLVEVALPVELSAKPRGARSYSTCVGLDTPAPALVICCGGDDGKQSLDSVEAFNPATGTWDVLPPLREGRRNASLFVSGGSLYVWGGFHDRRHLSSVERFSPATGGWNFVQPMGKEHRVVVEDAKMLCGPGLYSCGGAGGGRVMSAVERLNPETGLQEALPNMLEGRRGAVALATGGNLYVCGGDDGKHILASCERFVPELGIWEALPKMREGRRGACGCVMGGCLYICGGDTAKKALASAERFDPAVGVWEELPPIAEARTQAMMIAMPLDCFVDRPEGAAPAPCETQGGEVAE
eukprot:gnl/TRDRNA2_/TRDRNA2_80974_c0_seq1.p1 gnl/TRDRNA2_/TRDRNA2_80974_c0~~gnl/TRDRNA2_/TRDRNA2_80974_c0_seq1.p1  ORF type:complete len:359 (+),score=53.22 gnl/TRDRNA2_/TRDRNA2_80974_c0_seq1:53-1129(+)